MFLIFVFVLFSVHSLFAQITGVSITPATATICAGKSTTLTAIATGTGTMSYKWSPSNVTTASITVSPSTTTTYTVSATSSAGGGTKTATLIVTVNAKPTITTSSAVSICKGKSTLIVSAGANSYLWSNGVSLYQQNVTPTATTTFTVTGTNTSGCTATSSVVVTVNALPTVSVSASPATIVAGAGSVLAALGDNIQTWTWNNGSGINSSYQTVSPTVSTLYSVTGTDANTCKGTASALVTVGGLWNRTGTTLTPTMAGDVVQATDYLDSNGLSIIKPWMKGSDNIVFGNAAGYGLILDPTSQNQSVNNLFMGYMAGYQSTGNFNIFLGRYTGMYNTTGTKNIVIGDRAGNNCTGSNNIFQGESAGDYTTGNNNLIMGTLSGLFLTGDNNIALGKSSLQGVYHGNSTGANNTAIGQNAGSVITTGDNNIFLGTDAGTATSTGISNVYIGKTAGGSNNGNRNVFIGDIAGSTETNASNKLIIGTQENANLIYGDFSTNQIAIGTKTFYSGANGPYMLSVKGKIACQELKVDLNNWSDFVFNSDYKLRSLGDVEAYVKANKHLPEVPSAKEVEANGVSVGEMQATMMQKIEEMTLYMIQLQKQNDELAKQVESLKSEMKTMKQ